MAQLRDVETDLAVRAAWLSYVGGYTQEQIAQRLGVSRVKVHRLSSLAHDLGYIKVSIEHELASTVDLENRIVQQFNINNCIIVPTMDDAPERANGTITALGTAGARYLSRYLDRKPATTIGIGWGRTLSAMAENMLRKPRPSNRFVSVLGSLTRHAATNPYDVIHQLIWKTGAEGFVLPVTLVADTAADRALVMGQQSVDTILSVAREADLYLIGIGSCAGDANAVESGHLTQDELTTLQQAGAVGDVLGRFINEEGELVDCEINERVLGLELEALKERGVTALAGGPSKRLAILGALRMGVIDTLITDEETATFLVDPEPA